ncbi:hypothetical protein ACOSQ3_019421 [Xanthoceras sorbifolium]
MNFIFEVHLRRTTNPLGSRSNPEGSKIEPFWVRSRTQKGSKNDEPSGFEIEPRGFEDRTPLGSISNPEGFEDRTLLGSCLRTQKGSCLRILLGSISNPEGFEDRTLLGFEPSRFVEPRRVRRYEPFWVRGTQRVRRSNPLGSISNPEGFEDTNPEGFDLRTLWVQSRTQRVRGSSKMKFIFEERR